MSIVVRTARPTEFDAAGHLVAEAFISDGHTERDGDYAKLLRDPRDRAEKAELLVAVDETNGLVLGSVTFAPPGSPYADLAQGREGEFRMLAVSPDPAARGRGVGELMVRAVIARARELELPRVVMSSQQRMTYAHRIYERLGFVRTPERDWSPIPGVDLFTYALELDDSPA
ncbi:GNAT family N-acetyltransferase [Streptacidiphilus jiangxiensis]|uniref:Predicted N-acetyltransferase YhbS n=1 Tax=Streptacidiphilus jiangxiensis TaxID=235985 RepID=A0A1H7FZ57_STRJI|nr:GNAT family N-acetyltransferase [Streptacidiphilus jiangxiensis]SEK31084.1 Predicted N-acetyltransferase YhbS [Streptacidiphilus jiangxiensis]